MNRNVALLVAGLLLALSTGVRSQTPGATDKAPASAPATGAKATEPAPKRDLNAEAGATMKSAPTMPPDQKRRAAQKAEKQAQRAKIKAEDARKKADETKTEKAEKQAQTAQKKAEDAQKKAIEARRQAEEAKKSAEAAKK